MPNILKVEKCLEGWNFSPWTQMEQQLNVLREGQLYFT